MPWRPEVLAHGLRLEEDGNRCEINWEDVLASHGEKVTVENGVEGAYIAFGPFELKAGEELELDPTIESIYSLSSVSYNGQRRMARTSDGTLYAVYCNTNASGCAKYLRPAVLRRG